MSPHSAVFRPENNGVLTKRAFCTIILLYAPRICLWFLRKKGGTPVKQIKIPAMLLALALTGFIHHWKHNSLLSIGCGTLFYMFLVQQIFR